MTEFVRNHPLRDLIAAKGSVVIDGAMSTALESLGCNLNDSLWSAKILAEDPEKIYEVHRRYYEAGADVAITASYQASEAGFKAKGIGAEKAAELIALSVTLARRARDTVLALTLKRETHLFWLREASALTVRILPTAANTPATTLSPATNTARFTV